MSEITIGVVAAAVIALAAFLKAVLYLQEQMKAATKAMLAEEFAEMNKKIDDLKASTDKKIDELWDDLNKQLEALEQSQKALKDAQEEAAIEACKNFLTHALVDVENGADDEVLKQRIHSAHTWYNNHHQNSYIDTKFDKLVAEGKL